MSDDFFRKSRRLSDNVRKNLVETDRSLMTTWLMRIACWITKATNTHSECVMLIIFSHQEWLRELASVPRLYVHCLSCYFFVLFHLDSPVGTVTRVLQCVSC
jgi:hypothetical protein